MNVFGFGFGSVCRWYLITETFTSIKSISNSSQRYFIVLIFDFLQTLSKHSPALSRCYRASDDLPISRETRPEMRALSVA